MVFVIREGDPTTTGGTVVKGSANTTVEHRKAARISDPVWCPVCSCIGYIAEGNSTVIDEFVAVATHGHAVQCGCPLGNNRLIATQSSIIAANDTSVSIAPDYAAQAQAATHIWARAISTGAHASAFTASIPMEGLTGYTPPKLCVFAKTCTVAPSSTEAGTSVEPVANFGQAVVMGSTAVASMEGGTTLGRLAGQATLETLGTWSMRAAGAAAGSAASALLLALWPTSMGDSTLTEEQLRGMTAAPTRVRFQFRRDAEGIMRVYGLHTSASSGRDSVPVVNAEWNEDRTAMEAILNDIVIIWTPNNGPAQQAAVTYPGVTDALAHILIHPVAEGQDSHVEIYPASDDLTWHDSILVFPADSGAPPLYLVFAKPVVGPLEVDIYGAFTGRLRNGQQVDHMPSQAAIRRYLEANFRTLTQKQADEYLKKVAGVAIPATVHQKYSETYGGRNTRIKQLCDADDLRAAADSNFDTIKPYMLEQGFTETDLETARRRIHEVNEEQGWY